MPIPKSQKSSSRGLFGRYGGRMSLSTIKQHLTRIPLQPQEKKHIMKVLGEDRLTSSRITEREFARELKKMARNFRDPVRRQTVEKLKEKFGL